jgi:hypothetical protein
MTGGPKHGSGIQSSLLLELELGPGSTRQITFAQAALDTISSSFELARRSAARAWDAERARIELLNASQTLDIRTGDPDWDAVLAFSQTAALGLFFNGNEHLPHPSFVTARHTDNGFSRKGDGADYPPSWNGQTPLDAYYISSILPGAPDVTKKLILNFLALQDEDGEVDGKPGLVGQRGKMLAAPLLASLAWRYFQATQDEAFLVENFHPTMTAIAMDHPNGTTSCKQGLTITRFLMSGIPGHRGWIFPWYTARRLKPCCTVRQNPLRRSPNNLASLTKRSCWLTHRRTCSSPLLLQDGTLAMVFMHTVTERQNCLRQVE